MDLNFKNKQLLFFTWFGWSLLLILSLIYAEERILNIDGGFILSKIINDPDDLPHHIMRPVMMMILTIPMLFAKLSIKGKFLIYLISLLQVSISGFCIYWINHRIKKPKYSLGLLLTLILFGNYSFYWSIGELVYGMCFFWTWIAMIESEDKFSLKEIPWIFLWATCHPTVFFVIGFYIKFFI